MKKTLNYISNALWVVGIISAVMVIYNIMTISAWDKLWFNPDDVYMQIIAITSIWIASYIFRVIANRIPVKVKPLPKCIVL